MQTAFIGQGYGVSSSSAEELFGDGDIDSTGAAVAKSFDDSRFDSVTLCVAFATSKGVEHLHSQISSSDIDDVEFYVGIDEKVTPIEALEALVEKEFNTYVYRARQITYHPKVYIFEGEDRARVITGSSNLTEYGLYSNVEASTIIGLDKQRPEDETVLSDVKESLVHPVTEDSSELTPELIETLDQQGLIVTEAEQRQRRAEQRPTSSQRGQGDGGELFGVDVQAQPAPSVSTPTQTGTETSTDPKGAIDSLPPRDEMPPIPAAQEFETGTDRDYYRQLVNDPENQPSLIRRYVRANEEVSLPDLEIIAQQEWGYSLSGSFGASIHVLTHVTEEVRRETRQGTTHLIWDGE